MFYSSNDFVYILVAYNTANALFAGSAPVIQTLLVTYHKTYDTGSSSQSIDSVYDQRLRPAYYLMCVAALSLFCLVVLVPLFQDQVEQETSQQQQLAMDQSNSDWNSSTADGDSINLLHQEQGSRPVNKVSRPRHVVSHSDWSQRSISSSTSGSSLKAHRANLRWDVDTSYPLNAMSTMASKKRYAEQAVLASSTRNIVAKRAAEANLRSVDDSEPATNNVFFSAVDYRALDSKPLIADHSKSMSL